MMYLEKKELIEVLSEQFKPLICYKFIIVTSQLFIFHILM